MRVPSSLLSGSGSFLSPVVDCCSGRGRRIQFCFKKQPAVLEVQAEQLQRAEFRKFSRKLSQLDPFFHSHSPVEVVGDGPGNRRGWVGGGWQWQHGNVTLAFYMDGVCALARHCELDFHNGAWFFLAVVECHLCGDNSQGQGACVKGEFYGIVFAQVNAELAIARAVAQALRSISL